MTSANIPDAALVQSTFERLKTAQRRDGGLPVHDRRALLRRLRAHLVVAAEDYVKAAHVDFGRRSRHETLLTEVSVAISAIDHALPRLERWSRPTRIRLGFPYWPARARLIKQPRGVVGIISPSNYPLQLTIVPLVSAIAAGCRALLKPSELTPHLSHLMAEGIRSALGDEIAEICEGGADVAIEISRLPLDLLLFTGGAHAGAQVLAAAARTMTPVVLELGGKSPAIIDPSADLDRAAAAIMAGKLLNAGQTCVAPDYILVPRTQLDAAVNALRRAAARLCPDPRDLTQLLSPSASARLARLAAGQKVEDLVAGSGAPAGDVPQLIVAPAHDSAIMQEEIFGPLLPIVPYDTLEEAIAIVRGRPDPLALYWFGEENERFQTLLRATKSGAVSVNETVIHAGIHEIPFGGIGASGMGRYHGKAGFDTFTHERPVFTQARFNLPNLLRPPYGRFADRIIGSLIR